MILSLHNFERLKSARELSRLFYKWIFAANLVVSAGCVALAVGAGCEGMRENSS